MEQLLHESTIKGASYGLVCGEALGRVSHITARECLETFVDKGEAHVTFSIDSLYGCFQVQHYCENYTRNNELAPLQFARDVCRALNGGLEKGDRLITFADILQRTQGDDLLISVAKYVSRSNEVDNLTEWSKVAGILNNVASTNEITKDMLLIRCLGLALIAKDANELKEQCLKVIKLVCPIGYIESDMLFYSMILFQAVNHIKFDVEFALLYANKKESKNQVYRYTKIVSILMENTTGGVAGGLVALTAKRVADIERDMLTAGLVLTRGEQAFILSVLGAVYGLEWFTQDYYGIVAVARAFKGFDGFTGALFKAVKWARLSHQEESTEKL